ncbi:PQQ-dependent sugar dehydrogenase (plasmid) [Photobacterium sp. DA100]|uniref:LamG-like jellyroll fold domain-containing protein n=1 Tax=Photobacterium sp. DA100 TaxID=3027472 RepID=UPI00247A5DE0|nr:LamG-like jellyroll fold domain-containing protein [Photobacterium sp. DA100]WEM44096.1 PQQ-dependent sugar dehydrogenase [Photobacterium sp. DA100]
MDSSQYQRHGSPSGAFSFVDGVAGQAIQISDDAGMVSIPFAGWRPTSYTVSFWLKPNKLENYNQRVGAAWGAFRFHSNNNGSYYVGTSTQTRMLPGQFSQADRLVIGEWTHLAFTHDEQNILTAYVNGRPVLSQQVDPPSPWDTFTIGANSTTATLNGKLDELRVYGSALSADEVEGLYLEPAGPVGQGQIILSLPVAPAEGIEPFVTGQLWRDGHRYPVNGKWGEEVTIDGLPKGEYQLTLDNVDGYMPRFMPQLIRLEHDADSAEKEISYRQPIALDKLHGLPGVSVDIFATGLYQPRQMVEGNGVVYVGSSAIPLDSDPLAGMIYALDLSQQEGERRPHIVAAGYEEPHGVAYRNGTLYFSTVGGLYRITDIDQRWQSMPEPERIFTYPADDSTFPLTGNFRYWHQKHPIKFNSVDSNDNALYTAIGLPCNVCITPDERYGTILKIDLDTLESTIVAKGIRNSVGFDWHPDTGELWFSDNNRQGMVNPDEINRVSQLGQHFGAPYVFGADTIGILQSEIDNGPLSPIPPGSVLTDKPLSEVNPQDYQQSAFEVESNTAPLGVSFWQGFPADEGQQHLLFATHGNGHPDYRDGLEVRMLTITNGDKVTHERALVTGWMQDRGNIQSYACLTEACIGRPMEFLVMADGSLLVSDDKADVIYQVRYDDSELDKGLIALTPPSLPAADIEGRMISGTLTDTQGTNWPFYISWDTPSLIFDGLPEGEYTIKVDPIDEWMPSPAVQSVLISSASTSEDVTWTYQLESGLARLTLNAPTKPMDITASAVRVFITGQSTTEVLIPWGETRELEFPYGDYTVAFGYQYGAIPTPLTHAISLTPQAPSYVMEWGYRVEANVGETVLNENCSSCHGSQSSGLNIETVAERWFEMGFDALNNKILSMPMHCDSVCAEQVAKQLWNGRWQDYNPPALPEPPPIEGDVPEAVALSVVVDEPEITVSWRYSDFAYSTDNSWAPKVGADYQIWRNSSSFNAFKQKIAEGIASDEQSELTSLNGHRNYADYYGSRVRSYVVAERSGYYQFAVASDDHSELRFGEDKDQLELIASVNGWTNYQDWSKYATQQSEAVYLAANRPYLLEVLHHQGGGGDHLTVAWRQGSEEYQPIAGEVLGWQRAIELGIPEAVVKQAVQYQASNGQWQFAGDVLAGEQSFTFTPDFGGEVFVRVVSYNAKGEVNYSAPSSVFVSSLPANTVSTAGLELHWSFDSPDYFKVADDSGNGRDGSADKMVFEEFGPAGSFGLIDGDIHAKLDNPIALDDFTVSYWIKPHRQYTYGQFQIGDSWDSFYHHADDVDRFYIGVRGSSRFRTEVGTAIENVWQHFLYRRDADGNATLFRNGEVIERGIHAKPSKPLSQFRFSQNMRGGLDEVRLYSRALNDGEVLALYQTPDIGRKSDAGGPEEPDGPTLPPEEIGGQGLWEKYNCAACHGEDGNGEIPILSALLRDDIIDYISRTMPYGNAGQCDWFCAQVLTDWMRDTLLDGEGTPPVIVPPPSSDSALNAYIPDSEAAYFFYKNSLNLAGRLPTEEERERLRSEGSRALHGMVGDLLDSDAHALRIMAIYNDVLHLEGLSNPENVAEKQMERLGGNSRWYATEVSRDDNRALHDYLRDMTRLGIRQEGLQLIRYVTKEQLPFNEILSADYTMVNYYSARAYGVAWQANFRELDDPKYPDYPWDPTDFQPVRLGVPHAGLVSTVGFMGRYPTTATNVNRHRAATIYRLFLDTDIMEINGQRPSSDDEGDDLATLTNPACTGCHTVMDPVASAFKYWVDPTRPYRTSSLSSQDWNASMILPVGFNGEEAPYFTKEPLPWMTNRAANDPRFSSAVVKVLFSDITGHPLYPRPLEGASESAHRRYQRQQMDIERLAQQFQLSGYSIQSLVKDLVFSEYTLGTSRIGGTKQLLTPEQLDNKNRAVLGMPWNFRSNYNWLDWQANKYAVLYGGIDHSDVTERIEELTGVGASIQQRFSVDAACQVVPVDFSRQVERRFLFPLTEPNMVPAQAVRYEAEDAVLIDGPVIASNHADYSGEGFVEYGSNVYGEAIEWTVFVVQPGRYPLYFSYANANSTPRAKALSVNGAVLDEALDFPQTHSWRKWRNTQFIYAELDAGFNTVRLETNGNVGANIDYLGILPLEVSSNLLDEETLIKETIVELFWRLYGEEVSINDSQVERAYQVFTYAIANGMASGVSSVLNYDCNPARYKSYLTEAEFNQQGPHLHNDREFFTRSWIVLLTYLLKDQRYFYH